MLLDSDLDFLKFHQAVSAVSVGTFNGSNYSHSAQTMLFSSLPYTPFTFLSTNTGDFAGIYPNGSWETTTEDWRPRPFSSYRVYPDRIVWMGGISLYVETITIRGLVFKNKVL